jgi:hypothetical protein
MKKRLALTGIVLATIACVTVVWLRSSGITEDAYQRIQVGMTRKQVEGVLGGPARNESGNDLANLHVSSYSSSPLFPERWWGPDIGISITFDAQDRVIAKELETHDYGPQMLVDAARSKLPW